MLPTNCQKDDKQMGQSISYKIECAPVKTQIRLRIRAVWSEPSLFARRRFGTLETHRYENRLFKYIEIFYTKNWKLSDEKFW